MSPKNRNFETKKPVQSWSELSAAAQTEADRAYAETETNDLSDNSLIRPSEVTSGVRRVSEAAIDQGILPTDSGVPKITGPQIARRAFAEATYKPDETPIYPPDITIGGIRQLREQQNSDA